MSSYVTCSGTIGVFLISGLWMSSFVEKKKHQLRLKGVSRLKNSILLISDNIRLQQKPDPSKMFVYEKLTRGLLANSRQSPVSGRTLNSHGKAQKHSFTFFSGLFLFNTKIWLLNKVSILLFSTGLGLSSLIKGHWIPYELLLRWSQHNLLFLWSISIFMCVFFLFPRLIFFSRLDERTAKKKFAVPLTSMGAVLSR